MADTGNINLRALQLFIAVYDSHSFPLSRAVKAFLLL